MKCAILALTIALCLVAESQAFWGYSGFGRWGGMGFGLGDGFGGWGWSGYRYYRNSISQGDFAERTQCQYIVSRSVLSCKGPNSLIECEASASFMPEFKFELYGLAVTPGQENFENVNMCYQLYPRTLTNTAWLNHTIFINDMWMNGTLSYVEEKERLHPDGCGIAVHDLPCWKSLVDFFKTCNSSEVITIEGSTEVDKTVSLFGEIDMIAPEV